MTPVLIFKWCDLKGYGDFIILDRRMTLAEFNHVASTFHYLPDKIPFTASYPCYQGEECLVYLEIENLEKANSQHYLVSKSTVEELLECPEIPF